MSALAQTYWSREVPPAPLQPQIRWAGRRHTLCWSEDATSGQPIIELVDAWSGEKQRATVSAPGWIGREDEVVLRSAELARVLSEQGLIDSRVVAMQVGSKSVVLANLTPSGLQALAAGSD